MKGEYKNEELALYFEFINEFETQPADVFVRKYKIDHQLKLWQHFLDTQGKQIQLLLNGQEVDLPFIKKKFLGPALIAFHKEVVGLNIFPHDITLFFVMLEAAGFFDYYKVQFSDWMEQKNYQNPDNDDPYTFDVNSPKEWIFYHELGANVLRSKLIYGLDFWKFH